MRLESTITLRAGVLLLAIGLQSAMAAETGKSLYEQRQGIYQGTSRGIVLFGSESKPAEPAKDAKAAAPASVPPTATPAPAASASGPTRTQQASDAAAQDRTPLFSTPSLSKLAPPSGIPLNAVRHKVGAERGVALPVAKAASDAKP